MRILSEWYDKGKYQKEDFFRKYKEININKEVEEEYKKHQIWRKNNGISATPTIFINGYVLPDIYKIEEVAEFIELHIR